VSMPPLVIVIDDDHCMRNAAANLIASHGYRTEVYASAEQFIDQVWHSEASGLLIDMQLTGMSGIECARVLTSLGFSLPIILMTGGDDPMLRQQAIDLGCVAYLRKPLSPGLLMDALTDAVGKPRFD
jgi:FixJ family two-component response regulator